VSSSVTHFALAFEQLINQLSELLPRQPQMKRLRDKFAYAGRQFRIDPLAADRRLPQRRDPRPLPQPQIDDPLVLERCVGAVDGVEVDIEAAGKLPHPRQFIARPQAPLAYLLFDRRRNLRINRPRIGLAD